MHRFHLPPAECSGTILQLPEREAHHAVDVLRMRAGDEAVILDGAGNEFRCEFIEATRRRTSLRVLEKRTPPALPAHVTLFQAVPKAKAMDAIIQKATELGARRIVPLLTERCTVQLGSDDAAHKQEKWQHIAIEALKQCGAPWLPLIDAPQSLERALAAKPKFDFELVGDLRPGSRHPRNYFEEFAAVNGRAPGSIAVWVGPEGDFAPAEIEAIEAAGARPVTLGPQVLRCETAATFFLSLVSYEVQARQRTA